MSELPITTTRLLDQLQDAGQQEAWSRFDERYRPVLTGFARSLGLGDADAADVAAWTLAEFLREFRAGKYQRGRGRLRAWIIGIARNRSAMLRRAAARGHPSPLNSQADVPDDEAGLTIIWERERQRVILDRALEELRRTTKADERTMRAFELVALRGVPAEEAASQCGISVDDVYIAKSRVTRRLREIVERITSAYDEEA
ncbi:MAG: sigma-70 family RNA polymerase sigma factor [Phycisphaeraceae bacterium]|nr:MAG: sigma-70 family RNA polymerase sigma factor [Phycisphaeraceae bacterium]